MYSQPETINGRHELIVNMAEEIVAAKQLRFASVRLRFQEDGTVHRIVNSGSDYKVPPPSAALERLIAEKIALLKLAPLGRVIEKVGRRYSETVYYLRIFPEDMERMEMLFIRGELHEV